jgi:tol-pal system protein YbgF
MAVLLVVGCASRQQVMLIQEDTGQIRADMDSLKASQRSVQDTLCVLQHDLRDLRARSEYGSTSLEEKLQALAARFDEIVTRMDRALAPLEEFIRRQPASDSTQAATMGVDYYDAAMRDLSAGNYDLAEVGFLQFIENYPQSDLADDARYGLAETYYARKRYAEAGDEYGRVAALTPPSTKASAALLKLGLCYKAQNDLRSARTAWENLIKEFPYSEEAKVAAQRLDEIKGKK